jgi:hypothetical protein
VGTRHGCLTRQRTRHRTRQHLAHQRRRAGWIERERREKKKKKEEEERWERWEKREARGG